MSLTDVSVVSDLRKCPDSCENSSEAEPTAGKEEQEHDETEV